MDSDDDGASLAYAVTGQPAEGTASISGTTLSFAPGADFQDLAAGEPREVSVEVTATDAHGATAVNSVTVSVTGTNDAPVAMDQSIKTDQLGNGGFDQSPGFAGWTIGTSASGMKSTNFPTASINRSGNALADGDDAVAVLSFGGYVPGRYGTGFGPTVTSDAFSGLAGDTATFSYELSSGGDQANGTAYILDAATGAVVQQVFNYQTAFSGSTGQQQVDVTLAQSGDFTIEFRVGSYDTTGGYHVGATMEIGYAGIIRNGLDENGSHSFDGPVLLAGATDVDTSDVLNLDSIAGTSSNGASVTLAGGEVTYEAGSALDWLAAGETLADTFEFTITDGNGGYSTAEASIEITGSTDGPSLAAGTLAAMEDDASEILDLAALGDDVDSDDDGTTLTVVPGAGFQDPAQGETREVTVEVTATDAHGAAAVNSVTVTVTSENDGPAAVSDTASVGEDGPGIIIDLLANDTDAEGNLLSVDSFDFSGLNGTVTDNGDGTVTYDPNGAFEALDGGETATGSFSYTVSDGNGGTSTATVDVTVEGEDDSSGMEGAQLLWEYLFPIH